MRVLFTHSYFYRFDTKQWKDKRPYPPLGTIQAAALVREQGHEVFLFDVALKKEPHDIRQIFTEALPDLLVIYDDGFNYLTKMCLTNMREAAFQMATWAKEAGIPVAVCSSDSTDHYDLYLNNGVDWVIKGEGEETLKELIANDLNSSNVAGLVYRSEKKTITTQPRSVIRDLDSLPMPAWDLVDIDAYTRIWRKHQRYFSLNVATTRGCPFKCNWCAKPIYGNRYNVRSPEHVVNEIEYLVERFSPDHFWMCDDIFGLKPGWVQRFRNTLADRGLEINYKIQSRVDLLLQEDTIEALSASGAKEIWVGAESGSQDILDAMDKGTTIQQIHEATKLLKQNKIRVGFFIQFGYLGETAEDIAMTLKMIDELEPDDIGVSVSYPLPGTPFYEKVKSELKDKANWSDSDELALMFRNTYLPVFYKRLHRYVHKRFRKKQGFENLRSILAKPLGSDMAKFRSALATLYYAPSSMIDRQRLRRTENKMI